MREEKCGEWGELTGREEIECTDIGWDVRDCAFGLKR